MTTARRWFCLIFSCLLSWILMLTIFIITLPLWIVVVSYKYLVNAVVRFIHPDWTPLTGLDITCLGTTRTHEVGEKLMTNIGLTFVVEEDLDLRDFQEQFRRRILAVKSRGSSNCDEFLFHRLMEQPLKFMGHFYFSPASPLTNLDRIIYEIKTRETDYANRIIDWCSESYKKGQPLWEILLLKNEKEKGKTFVSFKMSHGLGDMVGVRNVMLHLLGVDSATDAEYALPKQSGWNPFIQSVSCDETEPNGVVSSKPSNKTETDNVKLMVLGPSLFLSLLRRIFSQPDVVSSSPRHEDAVTVDLSVEIAPLKEIRRAYGCRFSDVTLALLASSLRRFLLESMKEEELPSTIAFVSPRVMARSPSPISNNFTQLIINVPISPSSNKERLLQLRKESEAALKSGVSNLIYFLSALPALMPSLFLDKFPRAGISCVYSAIPIGEKRHLFGKHPVSFIAPITSMSKQIAIVSLSFSVGKELFLGILGNTGLFKDADAIGRMKTYFLQEMELLYKTTFDVEDVV